MIRLESQARHRTVTLGDVFSDNPNRAADNARVYAEITAPVQSYSFPETGESFSRGQLNAFGENIFGSAPPPGTANGNGDMNAPNSVYKTQVATNGNQWVSPENPDGVVPLHAGDPRPAITPSWFYLSDDQKMVKLKMGAWWRSQGTGANVYGPHATSAAQAPLPSGPGGTAPTILFGGSSAQVLTAEQIAASNAAAAAQRSPATAAATSSSTTQLSFTNTSGGSNAQLTSGDYWRIAITGAAPNTPVTIAGGKNGGTSRTPAGATDASGAFTLTGQVTDSDIGSWSEQWIVGTVPAGAFSFTVTARPPVTNTPGTAPAGTPTGTFFDGGNPATALIQELLPASLSTQPWYVLAGGAVAALWIFHSMTKGGRR